MQPKTVIQKKVVDISSKLPAISEKQIQWAYANCFDHYVVRQRNTLFCLECGHSWKDAFVLGTTIVGNTCPSCNAELKLWQNYRVSCKESEYYAILDTRGDMQVVRMLYVTKFMKKNMTCTFSSHEVMQHWIDQKGKITVMSKVVMGLSHYCDQWVFESNLEVRPVSWNSGPRFNLCPSEIYPIRKISPAIKRNGFKGHFHNLTPHKFFSLILSNSRAETLLKAGQFDMLRHLYNNPTAVECNWPSIKICLRHNYIIKDASLWLDLVHMLYKFGKDQHSPKYVCPADLKKEPDYWMKKQQILQAKIDLERKREKIEKAQKKFEKQKAMFFDLRFKDGDIEVVPLTSVQEFLEEGTEMHHCVFSGEYYDRKDSLILSARNNGQRIETIEVILSKMEITQSRGKFNKSTEYHNRIVDLVKANLPKIAKQLAV